MSDPLHRIGRDTRIKEGEIRNPWGRNGKPKPQVGFLDQEITISLNGTAATITRREALAHFLFAKAAQGAVPANRLLHMLYPEEQSPDEQPTPELSQEEQEVLQAFIRQQARTISGGGT